MKKVLIGLLIVVLVPVVALVVIGRVFFPDNIAESAPDGGEKGIRTLYLKEDRERVADISRRILKEMRTEVWGGEWRIVSEESNEKVTRFRVEVPVVFFTDDLVVTIREDEGKTIVDARSSSRVGKSDFGENARHIRQYFALLESATGGRPMK
ncbi:MAG: DUF1499 domain-containing protein [Pyrinomonadaceae bacterium]